jgi:ABC-type glucose/galactose transport system permease subunit
MKVFGSAQRLASVFMMAAMGAVIFPQGAFASTLRTNQARQHFGWMEQLAQLANGVVPLLSMLAIVGGLLAWGIAGGSEGIMKKLGPVVAAFGVAGFILSSGSFLGIGAAVL